MNDTAKLKIACIGEAMIELSLNENSGTGTDDIAIGFAGDTLNTAIYLKRLLGDSAEIAFCTTLGKDPLSVKLKKFIESESISTEQINHSDTKTVGLYAIATDASGERSFSYWRSDSAARTLFQSGNNIDFSSLENSNIIYLSAITLAIIPANVRKALLAYLSNRRKTGSLKVAFDSNYRKTLWESESVAQSTVADFWKITDIALPSVDDEMDLFNDADETAVLKRFTNYHVGAGALKRGEKGPLPLPDWQQPGQQYPSVKNVVDSTAAGDSFNAGYLSVALTGGSTKDALMAGHNCASRVISCRGAIIPTQEW